MLLATIPAKALPVSARAPESVESMVGCNCRPELCMVDYLPLGGVPRSLACRPPDAKPSLFCHPDVLLSSHTGTSLIVCPCRRMSGTIGRGSAGSTPFSINDWRPAMSSAWNAGRRSVNAS